MLIGSGWISVMLMEEDRSQVEGPADGVGLERYITLRTSMIESIHKRHSGPGCLIRTASGKDYLVEEEEYDVTAELVGPLSPSTD